MKDLEPAHYFRPTDLCSALDWLAANEARVVAGCTDLLASTNAPHLAGSVLDVKAIPELRGITSNDKHWRFGATTTWTDVIRADLPPAFDSLKLAAREVGSQQIQNAGTLAGNLCNASPAADGVPCWLTLDAHIELRSKRATRVLALNDFITGPRRTELANDEIVSAILVPLESAAGRSTFLKLGARKYLIISIAMAAVRLVESGGLITDITISLGSCGPVATRLTALEEALKGQPLSGSGALISDTIIEGAINPIDDLRSDANGRNAAAAELVRRCIANLSRAEASAA